MTYLFSLLICFLVSAEHDLHVSVTDIAPGSDDEIFVVSRIFLDDLQTDMNVAVGPVDMDDVKFREAVHTYLSKHLILIIDKTSIEGDLVDMSFADLALSVRLKYTVFEIDNISKVEIRNTILNELYDDQMNLINFHLGHKTRSKALMFGRSAATFYL